MTQIAPWFGLAPRGWQSRALEVLSPVGRAPKSRLVHAVMGSGKTVLIVACAASCEGRVLVVEPTLYLVSQTMQALSRLGEVIGECSGLAKATDARVVVCCEDSIEAAGTDYALVIVDEAHGSEAPTLRAALDALRPHVDLIGFSATPARAGKEGLSLFEYVAFSYKMADALRDGVIVPPKIVSYTGDPERPLDDVCVEYCAEAVDELGPGVVNATSIVDAQSFARKLQCRGISAACIHSQQPRALTAAILKHSRDNEDMVLVHVNMLAEGVDLPWLRWIVLRRATASKIRFAQEVGRVLRAYTGKEYARVYDPQDLFGAHRLDVDACLDALPDREPAPVLEGDAWGDTVCLLSGLDPIVFGIGPRSKVRVELVEAEEYARLRFVLAPSVCRSWDAVVTSVTQRDADAWDLELSEALPVAGRVTVRRCDFRELDARRAASVRLVGTSLTEAQRLLRSEAVALDAAGLVPRKLSSRSWRSQPSTSKQREFAKRLLDNGARHLGLIDPVLSACLSKIMSVQVNKLDRGSASDLITIALAVVKGDLDGK